MNNKDAASKTATPAAAKIAIKDISEYVEHSSPNLEENQRKAVNENPAKRAEKKILCGTFTD